MKGARLLMTKMIILILKYFDSLKKKKEAKATLILSKKEKDLEKENWEQNNKDKLFLNTYDLSSYQRKEPSFSNSYKY